jgi:hypothetical protein
MARSATAEEAAAIAAAIEQFNMDTGAAPSAGETRVGPWQRAALIEGVGAKATIEDLEGGGARWQS